MPASARSRASSTGAGAAVIGRDVTSSISTPSQETPIRSSAAAMLAATWRLGSSATSATRS
jgi:hypothetical protein